MGSIKSLLDITFSLTTFLDHLCILVLLSLVNGYICEFLLDVLVSIVRLIYTKYCSKLIFLVYI